MATRVVALDLIARNRQSAVFAKVAADANRTAARLNAAGAKMTAVGARMTRGITLPIVAVGAASAKLAIDFQDSMQKIVALVGVSQKQVDAWGKDILALAPKVRRPPQELADALYFVTSSGISVGKAMGVVKVSAKAAAAGLGNTRVVADAVTSAMNAYGERNLSAARATDILTAAVKAGKGEPEDLAASIGRVIAPAQKLHVSFGQVAAAMSAMTLVGLKADESATALRGVLTSLQNPTAQQTKALEHMHLSLTRVRDIVAKQGLLSALKLLAERSRGNVEATAALFGNVRALNGFLILTGKSAGTTAKVFDDVRRSTGSTSRAFREMGKTASERMHAASAAIQASAVRIGTTLLPIVARIADKLAQLVGWWDRQSPAMKKVIKIAAGVAAALGPVLSIAGRLTKTLGAVVGVFGRSGAAAGGAAAGTGKLRRSVGLLGVAIAGAAAGYTLLNKVFTDTTEKAAQSDDVWQNLIEAFKKSRGVIDDTVKATQRANLVTTSLAKKAAQSGISLDQLTTALVGPRRGFDELIQVWKRMGDPSAQTLDAFRYLRTEMFLTQQQAAKVSRAFAENRRRMLEDRAAARATAGPINHLAGALHGGAGRAREFAQDTDRLRNRLIHLPSRKSIDVRVADHYTASLRNLQARLNSVPRYIPVTVQVNQLGTVVGGHLAIRDSGGPVTAKTPYLIGVNRRPEVFVPETNGQIVPVPHAGGGVPLSGRGGTVITVNLNGAVLGNTDQVTHEIVNRLEGYYRGNYPSKGSG